MKHSQESFLQLVSEAYDGTLQLPAFQREWKWERNRVISLFDSLRKGFPIGSFLFIEVSPEYNLSPHPFFGSKNKYDPNRLTLDGQQRITSGIVLLYGALSSPRYFIDLKALKNIAEDYFLNNFNSKSINYKDDNFIHQFTQELDDSDDYMIATTKKTGLETLLLDNHLLSSTCLLSKITSQKALEPYEDKYPETKDFLRYLIIPNFSLESICNYPVTTLTKEESLSAITKIFATINTTSKSLTPIEIVTAILYSSHVDLKEKVKEFQQLSDYLINMDKDGELLLQTIALLSNKTPKKSMLPKTITYALFKDNYEEALDLLDRVGLYLTSSMGLGLKDTDKLIPYTSILSPMAICFKYIKNLKGKSMSNASEKIDKWFIGSALGQRYIEGSGTKQEIDVKGFKDWIVEDKAELKPAWLENVHLSKDMVTASMNSSIGKLIKCLINREKPLDPLEKNPIGYFIEAQETPEDHHIWPKRFCSDHLPGWNPNTDTVDHALNIMPVCSRTNKKWANMDPKNMMDDIKVVCNNENKRKQILEKLFISTECEEILNRPNKTKQDYADFLNARFKVLCEKLSYWDFSLSDEEEPYEDDINNQSLACKEEPLK